MTAYPSTIARPVEHELVIRKSRFLTHTAPVGSVADADEFIAGVRKRYWDARHNCTAMVTGLRGEQARSNDDGEPSGTAGVPMLEVLRQRRLTDLAVVVTRYFGGIKLGAGGLVRAYSSAVSECLDDAALVERQELTEVMLAVDHADAGRVDNLLRDWVGGGAGALGEPDYAARATLRAWVPAARLPELADAAASWSGGALVPEAGAVRVVDVPA
ncbi:YigZ family protein [Microbacterium marinilacus]|uniref:YigZ family protein n=2 Tax=Microbacterium marinilacus TaxID=415209 RepID=A0ABP7BEJ7_9MICO|nr:YigZ family protein [Microbacterium marinilacus]